MKGYNEVRSQTQFLCDPLEIEDFVVQPVMDVSPLKWHLGHTTWFFENFILVPNMLDYKAFHPKYAYLFNSYYISAGDRWSRENRGQLTRPTVKEVFEYRSYVDEHMKQFLENQEIAETLAEVLILGMNHEQQHQELFLYDIKRILGDNPLFPVYRKEEKPVKQVNSEMEWLNIDEGIYEIGHEGNGFHFDNEEGRHKVFLHEFQICSSLITNGEYLKFIEDGGYRNHMLWLSEAWDWVNENEVKAPRYWNQEDGGEWGHYTLHGYEQIKEEDPVCHISFYEADAFARWRGCRLPTEQEWEVACKMYSPNVLADANFVENKHFKAIQTSDFDFFGNLWEWTSSPYVSYPYYNPPEGALGEYNGKFMVNQMVLRGGSFGTPRNHIRATYRNFFHPHLRWMFSGIRLAKYI
ncbi:ergothioneine biosynthesis protein EgtB [Ekhidna lutea]|uniref:ergothioneine biosynthesis protein EgtB n=1 Tax=Ekhidna lutea TaxID=447679 RepID=UPI001FE3B620|nr:ergothioneine biosynthesis protein EgtB [Ekhidna lutea]